MATKSLQATIFGVDKASPTFEKVGKSATDLAGDMEKAGGRMGSAFTKGAKMAAGALAAIKFGDFVKDTISQASALEQNTGAIGAVFKSTAADIESFGDSSARTVGLARQQYYELATVFGSQLKNMGLAADELAPKTNELVQLGADLSSMYGGTAADAVQAISSLLRGERNPIERYGVTIKQASIDAYTLAHGLDTSTAAAKVASDTQATLALLFDQSSDAQGNFARELDTQAGAQQVATALFKEAQAEIGTKLLPIVTDLTTFAADNLIPVLGLVADALGGVIDVVDAVPGPVKAALAAMIGFRLFQQTAVFAKITAGARGFREEMVLQQHLAAASGQEISRMNAVLATTQTRFGGLAKSLGKAGLFAGGVWLISEIVEGFTHVNQSIQDIEASVKSLGDQLRENNGIWDESIQKSYENAVMSSDVFQALVADGADAGKVLAALTGQQDLYADSLDEVRGHMSALSMDQAISIESLLGMRDATVAYASSLSEYTARQQGAAAAVSDHTAAVEQNTAATSAATAANRGFAGSFGDVELSAASGAGAMYSAGAAMNEWINAQKAAAEAADALQHAQAEQVDSMLSLHDAAGELGSAIGDFEGSLTDANGELDLSNGAVRDIASEMRAYGDAAVAAATATAEQTGSLDAGRAVADQARAAFIDLMISQGHTRAEAERLAQQMGILNGIDIHNKTFTITAIDNASSVMSRIAQLASMLGINTSNAGTSAGAAMAQWLRQNPDQIAAAYQSAVAQSVKISATSSSSPSGSGGGGGGGSSAKKAEDTAKDLAAKVKKAFDRVGVPLKDSFDVAAVGVKRVTNQINAAQAALDKAVEDGLGAKQAAKMQRQIDKWRAEVEKQVIDRAADRAAEKSDKLAERMRDLIASVGTAVSKPFDIASVGAELITEQLSAAGAALRKSVKRGLDKEQAKELGAELARLAAEFGRQMQDVFDRIRTDDFDALRASIDADTGSVTAMRSAVRQLADDLKTVGARSASLDRLALIEGRLTAAMDQRAAVTADLAAAQSRLNGLMTQYEQRLESVRDSIVAYADITNIQATNSIGWLSSVDDAIAQFGQRSDEIGAYVDDLERLRSMGLNETMMTQLEDAGLERGWAQVRLLAGATDDQIAELNRLSETVLGEGSRLGKMSADSMYGAGIKAAQSMVDGLVEQQALLQSTITNLAGDAEILAEQTMYEQGQAAADGIIKGLASKQSELDTAIRKIGKQMVKAFKAEMDIHSPSGKTDREVGSPMGQGVINGFVRTLSSSRAMQESLANVGLSTASIGRAAGSAMAAAGTAAALGPLKMEIVLRSDGGEFAEMVGRIADVRITDAQGRDVQVNRMMAFEAV